ncbi:MAG: DUF3473 domain-containing protein [Spirochaetales bacterium]|nr:DUF3473 domain-containing protein [Spirochaetales bacterium]
MENLKGAIPRDTWESQPRRVVANTRRILDILERTGIHGTFFCLGWIAEREAALIREIADRGHEVASHGYDHRLIYEQRPSEFRDDVVRAKHLLEDISGAPVLGYRAPSFSITDEAIDILAQTGYRYDSSWFPVAGHDRYGRVDMQRHMRGAAETGGNSTAEASAASSPLANGLIELPITTVRIGRHPVPWGGGGWFRLYPQRLFVSGFRRSLSRCGGGTFYLHPWEVDPDQPRVRGIRRSYAFRHYVNLHRTGERLEQLCRHVPFVRADEFLELR